MPKIASKNIKKASSPDDVINTKDSKDNSSSGNNGKDVLEPEAKVAGKDNKGGLNSNELVLKGTEYTAEYAQKLKDTYKIFKNNGYEISEHGLNRVLGRIKQGKIGSMDDVLDVLNTGTKYKDTINGGTILFKNGISTHVAEDGFVKTVIGKAKVKSTWEVIN